MLCGGESLESIHMDKVEMKNDDIYEIYLCEWVVGGKSFLGAESEWDNGHFKVMHTRVDTFNRSLYCI